MISSLSISVIVPVNNGARYILESLRSIYAQSVSVLEVICVDDGSTDNTVERIKSHFPRVQLISNHDNRGPSYSRNRGIELATGNYIAFLDADDIWEPDHLAILLSMFKANPTLMVAAGHASYFYMEDPKPDKVLPPRFNAFVSAMLMKRAVFQITGLFDESLRLSEDQDLLLRIRELSVPMEVVERVVLNVRIHNHNTTKGLDFKGHQLIDILKKSLDRRRASDIDYNLSDITKHNNA